MTRAELCFSLKGFSCFSILNPGNRRRRRWSVENVDIEELRVIYVSRASFLPRRDLTRFLHQISLDPSHPPSPAPPPTLANRSRKFFHRKITLRHPSRKLSIDIVLGSVLNSQRCLSVVRELCKGGRRGEQADVECSGACLSSSTRLYLFFRERELENPHWRRFAFRHTPTERSEYMVEEARVDIS